MRKFYFRLLLILVGFVALTSVNALPAGAHTISPLSKQHALSTTVNSGTQCSRLLVHLNGSNPATKTCLDKKDSKGRSIPNTYVSQCTSETVIIYADSNYSGWTICFYGEGFANMTDYCGPAPEGCFWNWNDQASSYKTGCYVTYFYADINTQGTNFYKIDHRQGNFSDTNIGNDALSSVDLVSYVC